MSLLKLVFNFIKNKYVIAFFVFCLCIIGTFAFFLFRKQTSFEPTKKSKYIYIHSFAQNRKKNLLQTLDTSKIIKNIQWFEFYANKTKLWSSLKPGRYEIKQGMSIYNILQILKSGSQSPLSFVINKIRSKEQLAGICGNAFEPDSSQFISFFNSPEFAEEIEYNPLAFLHLIIPNTYFIFWNTSPQDFTKRMIEENKKFWTLIRLQKAGLKKLTPLQISTIASIVEEETTKNDEKPIIASVYLNRLQKNMKLEADPTVKFCTQDFGLRRITFKHINQNQNCLFNTYAHYGLPPGPICTPSIITIDAVLNAPTTNYLYFCARPERDGYHSFATSYQQHLQNARKFHQMLNQNQIK